MKRKLIALGILSMMVLGTVYAFAYGPHEGPHRRGGYCWEAYGTGGFSPEQRTKFQELRQRFFEETAKLRAELMTKRMELHSLWSNPNADPKTILEKERELRDLQTQIREKGLQLKLEARQWMTPEQISEFGACGRFGVGFGSRPMKGRAMGSGRGPHF